METPSQHDPPSLPNSPLPKRLKSDPTATEDPAAAATPTPMPEQPNESSAIDMPSISNIPPSSMNGAVPTMQASTTVPPLLVQKLSPTATTPTRGSAFAAGYDLYASAPLTIKARNKGLVSTSLAIAVPAGTYGRVAPRSGLASKHFLDTGAGVIDADYRGEVKVLLFNFSEVDYDVKQGERVAQLVLERIVTPEVVEVETLETTVRGIGGFGSTGYI